MTKSEWIENNHSFYHITATKNLDQIYKEGLQTRNGKGICVVRSNHPLIIEFITETMLIGEGETEFSVIQIFPQDHNLKVSEIEDDNVVEATNDLHNYILRNSIKISSKNVVGEYKTKPLGIPDLPEFERKIADLIKNLD